MSTKPSTSSEESDFGPSSYPGADDDIPPAIACAHCGDPKCDGCAPSSRPPLSPDEGAAALPWEEPNQLGLVQKMVETSEVSVLSPARAFGGLGRGSIMSALGFAFLCELWAVASFTLVWACLFYAALPFVAKQMLSSPAVLILASLILTGLILFVVAVHALWGIGIEWGIRRAGGTADFNRGLRFGLYACGWDLLTSPAGVYFQWQRAGFKMGMKNIRAATKAPRTSFNTYLVDCRQVNDSQKKSAVWTSIWLGLSGVAAVGFIVFASLLLAWLPWILY